MGSLRLMIAGLVLTVGFAASQSTVLDRSHLGKELPGITVDEAGGWLNPEGKSPENLRGQPTLVVYTVLW